MRVLTYNINGLRSATGKGLYAWLAPQAADVVCLQEVRAQEHQLPPVLVELAGYRAHWLCATRRKGYSGVGLLAKERPAAISCGLSEASLDDEGRLLRADFGRLSVISLYVPSGITGAERQAHKMVFLGKLLAYLSALKAQGRELLVCGDFNIAHRPIDLARPASSEHVSGYLPEERQWMDALLAAGFVDVLRKLKPDEPGHYTWWTAWGRKRNEGWRLDYQIATPALAERAKSAHIFADALYSDHAPLLVEYDR